jgi:hypothetical protein
LHRVSFPHPASIAVGVLLAAAHSAGAQYTVTSGQPLAFGYLTQGVTEVVPYTDSFRRGVVSINGTGVAYIRVFMPTTLSSPQGATIPLQFLAGDVAAQDNGKQPQAFDPAVSASVNLNRGTASLFLGGRALTGVKQRAGLYSATVVVIVSPIKF